MNNYNSTFSMLPIGSFGGTLSNPFSSSMGGLNPLAFSQFPTMGKQSSVAKVPSQLPSFFGGLSTFGTGVTPMAASLSSPVGGGAPLAGSVFPPTMSKESPSFGSAGGDDGGSPMSSFNAELAYLKESIDRLKAIPNKTISQEIALNDAEKIYAQKATEMATLSSGKPVYRPMVAKNTRLA